MTANRLAPTILTVVGGGLTLGGLRLLFHAWATEQWPTVPGRVISSRVSGAADSDGDPMFQPAIEYEYTVAGQRYTGRQVGALPHLSTSWRGPAVAMARRYPKGADCRVHHDPGDAARALLEPGARWYLYLFPLLGLVLLGLGVAGFAGRIAFGGDTL